MDAKARLLRRREAVLTLAGLGLTGAVGARGPACSARYGQPDTSHAEDMIYAQAGRSRATLKLARRSGGRKGYRGVITLGVAT